MEKTNINKEITTRIEKIDVEKQLVAGVVMEPDVVDLQGDIYDADEIEKACHSFNRHVRLNGLMHKDFTKIDSVYPVESYTAPAGFRLDEKKVLKGSWIMVTKVEDKDTWDRIKKGELTGFSVSGVSNYQNLEG